MAYILPKVGELWLDQDGHRNLILRERWDEAAIDERIYSVLTLDTGEVWQSEHESGWYVPYRGGPEGESFYYRRIG